MVSFVTIMRRFTACILLATYGSVGVLGYGLHALWHVHHHHGPANAASSGTSCSCCSHHCSSKPQQPAVDSTDILAKLENCQLQCHSHTKAKAASNTTEAQAVSQLVTEGPCPICAMLSQSQSPGVAICSGWLVSAVSTERPVDEILQLPSLPSEHPARGPPAC